MQHLLYHHFLNIFTMRRNKTPNIHNKLSEKCHMREFSCLYWHLQKETKDLDSHCTENCMSVWNKINFLVITFLSCFDEFWRRNICASGIDFQIKISIDCKTIFTCRNFYKSTWNSKFHCYNQQTIFFILFK